MKTKTLILVFFAAISFSAFAKTSHQDVNIGKFRNESIRFYEKIENLSSIKNAQSNSKRTSEFYEIEEILKHSAEAMTTHNWNSDSHSYDLYTHESFKYENGLVTEVIKEIPNNDGFVFAEKVTYSYHQSGKLFEKINYYYDSYAEAWQKNRREEYIYDVNDNLILETLSDWSNPDNDWVDYFKFRQDISYNANGNPDQIKAYFWSLFISDGSWYPSYMDEYDYDEYGRKIEAKYSVPSGLDFVYSNKEEYYYEDNNPEFFEVLVSSFETGEWMIVYKITDIYWFDFDRYLIESFVIWSNEDMDDWKSKEDFEWYPYIRITSKYHPVLFEETLFLEEYYFFDEWFEVFRRISFYNEYNFKVRYEEQYNVGFYETEWETDSGYFFDGEFDEDGQPVELFLSTFDWWDAIWVNYKWFDFGKTDEDDNTTLAPIYENDILINIYPNPVKDVLYISSNNFSDIMIVSIYDVSGKLAKTQNLSVIGGENILDISCLRQGLYFVKISTGKETQVFKVIKQ